MIVQCRSSEKTWRVSTPLITRLWRMGEQLTAAPNVKTREAIGEKNALLPEQPEAVAKAVLDFLAKHHPTDKP